ncbi:hypothetical protein NQ318_001835 [Aromia moschata]|uniref:C2H2-type domain-containing protein n=1 Tax=Aromia moschata TaxID=1265417 RepID=A0AAV8Z3V8_9CUCU|nr:hypothetical protein NQ318_001835 [Aromia moschata]
MKPRNKKNTCGLCHVTCTSFQAVNKLTMEVLEVLLLKTTLHHTEASVICKSCETKLEQLFKFKTVCLETEDCLVPFLDSKTHPYPLNLRDVYLDVVKDTNNVATKPKNRVCRLCMQLVEGGFTSLTDLEGSRTLQQNILVEYMPEVNLEATKEPVICTTCEESLQNYYNFALNISNVTPTVPQPQSAVDDSAEESDSSPSVSGEDEQNFSSLQYRNDKLYRPKAALYECKFCLYKSHSKRSLKLHQKIHEGKKWSGFYKQHDTTHKNGSDYRCDVCGYEADHTGRFKRHLLIHSKAKNHKCNECSFVTHRLDTLRDHMQTHVPLSERNLKKMQNMLCSGDE